tara:strand:+ start:134 stop:433 length:300 start_codon:yes stop_codon:yes gene_type:complete
MAFKMNKSVFNFGEGTGSSPNKNIFKDFANKLAKGAAGRALDLFKNKDKNTAEGNVVTDTQTQDGGDPNLEANKAMKLATGQTSTTDEKINAISEIINS